MVAETQKRLAHGVAIVGEALSLPFADGAFDRVFTAHFYGHLPPDERTLFLAEARRVANELIVVDSARRPETEAEGSEERVLNDGSRHQVFKRYLRPDQLAEEIDGRVLLDGDWFIAARTPATQLPRS